MADDRVPSRVVRTRFPALRDDQLRSLAQWRLVLPAREQGETWYSFADLSTLRAVHEALERGLTLKAVVRSLLAQRQGQLTLFDGTASRDQGARTRVVALSSHAARPARRDQGGPPVDASRAEEAFERATAMDGTPGRVLAEVMDGYREALAFDPQLVPALINLGNLHYGHGHLPEAAALYDQAVRLAPDAFEGWFNLGHTHHDGGRYADAVACYTRAVDLAADSADACFYLSLIHI